MLKKGWVKCAIQKISVKGENGKICENRGENCIRKQQI